MMMKDHDDDYNGDDHHHGDDDEVPHPQQEMSVSSQIIIPKIIMAIIWNTFSYKFVSEAKNANDWLFDVFVQNWIGY